MCSDTGTDGLITSSSSSELLTICLNLLPPFTELLAFEVRRGEGYEFTGFVFGFCSLVLKKFSIKEAVEISKSSPDVGLMEMERWLLEFERCRRHRNDPAWVVGAHRQGIFTTVLKVRRKGSRSRTSQPKTNAILQYSRSNTTHASHEKIKTTGARSTRKRVKIRHQMFQQAQHSRHRLLSPKPGCLCTVHL